jgi:hypothetical protein
MITNMLLGYISIIVFAFLSVFSFFRIRSGKKIAEFTYDFAFLIGAFVWEDLFVFSVYGLAASIATVWLGQWKYGLLFFLVFWMVRSAGETLYFFLEQFIEPKHYPHYIDEYFGFIRFLFGKISYQQCLIIMQVFFQTIMMTSIVALTTLLFAWNRF